jgi:hypothetical protein
MQAFKQHLGGGINYETVKKEMTYPTRGLVVDEEDYSQRETVPSSTVPSSRKTTPSSVERNDQRAEDTNLQVLSRAYRRYTIVGHSVSQTAGEIFGFEHSALEVLPRKRVNKENDRQFDDSRVTRRRKKPTKGQTLRVFYGSTQAMPLKKASALLNNLDESSLLVNSGFTVETGKQARVNQSANMFDRTLIKEQRQEAKLRRRLMEEKVWSVFIFSVDWWKIYSISNDCLKSC